MYSEFYFWENNMKIVEQYSYSDLEAITDSETGKRVYVTPDNERLASVTTILGATQDTTALDAWRARIGDEEADKVQSRCGKSPTQNDPLDYAEVHAHIDRP